MLRKLFLTTIVIGSMLSVPLEDCLGRGGRGGGGGGGGFSGGVSRGGGSGGRGGSGGFGGGGASRGFAGGGSSPGASRGQGGFGGTGAGGRTGRSPGGIGNSSRAGAGAGRGPGGAEGNRFSSPNSGQLNNFLGLPSDEGMHGFGSSGGVNASGGGGAAARNNPPQHSGAQGAALANRNSPEYSAKQGAAVANRNSPQYSGAQGATAGAAAANRNAPQYSGAQGAAAGYAAGSNRYGAGFNQVRPSTRYNSAAAVRSNYNHWDVYGDRWHTDHPGAWYAAGWTSGAAWRPATWNSVGTWLGDTAAAPVYYDYGDNITYQGDSVYVNGEDAGTTQQYSQQASDLAAAGAKAAAPADGDWLPLGVFAFTKTDKANSIVTIELAINKQGVIRGNYTDTKTDKTQPIKGSVNKQTQRVAFIVGDNQAHLIETGLYNLTKDEAPCLVHVDQDQTQQWLLVRLQQPDSGDDGNVTDSDNTNN